MNIQGKWTNSQPAESVEIPPEILLDIDNNPENAIVNETFPDLVNQFQDEDYIRERAILKPKNKMVTLIDEFVVEQIPGEKNGLL